MTDRASLAFGSTTIDFALRRSNRRRTVSIAVDGDEGVVVTAPLTAERAAVDRVVRARAMWILERLRRRRASAPPPPPRELVSGETFRYLGRQVRLALERKAEVAPLRLEAGRLYLPVPRGLPLQHESNYARAALLDWYAGRAERILPRRAAAWASLLGVTPTRVLVAEPGKRWGSAASDGTVRFNWRIVQAPRRLIDYVVAHEIVHLVHPHHGAAFWALLGRVMPDYEVRRNALRECGAALVW